MFIWLTLVTSDIDECVTGMDNCDENAVCIDTFGGFTCVCNAGFTGDGVNCVVGEWVVVFSSSVSWQGTIMVTVRIYMPFLMVSYSQ